jgi:alpha-beta hydrolase superfamily lysophospholipase
VWKRSGATVRRQGDGFVPDVLGPGFRARTLPLTPDDEGDVVATLVTHVPREDPARAAPNPARAVGHLLRPGPLAGCDVLYVHGWSDYFFQAELARKVSAMGARFFALDLRKYGRSLRSGQTPGYVTDLATYDEDIQAALSVMGTSTAGRKLVLLGHSTGGLTLSLWAARHPGRAAGLILNSPWLEFQASRVGRQMLAPLMQAQSRLAPRSELPNVDLGFYTRAVAAAQGGEWTYNEEWRPERGFRTRPGWMKAILEAHAKVLGELSLEIPVLTLLSTKSMIQATWSDEMRRCDTVLVVDQIAERATRLGPDVSIRRLDGALHDVFLSASPVREAGYAAIRRWAGEVLG